jgi:hypothetical protein
MEQIFLGAHLLILFCILSIILVAHYSGLQWFRGHTPTLGLRSVTRLHTLMWVCLSLMVTTGALLFWPVRNSLLGQTAFWVKMGFILTLFINAFFIGRLMHIATVQTFASLTRNEKILFLSSGLLSLTSWVGAMVSASFLS